jgi:hypothetical protein
LENMQNKVNIIFTKRGYDYVEFAKLGLNELGFQVTRSGRVVCFPTCSVLNLVDGVCSVCGEDMGRYFKMEKDGYHKGSGKNPHDVEVSSEWVKINEEWTKNEALRPIRYELNTEEERTGKLEILKTVVDKLDTKLRRREQRLREKERGKDEDYGY